MNETNFNNNDRHMKIENPSKKKFLILISVLITLLVLAVILLYSNSEDGVLKTAELNAPSIIYLGENEEINSKAKGSGNLRQTIFNYSVSNSSIVNLESEAGKKGKKTTNKLIPISTGKFLVYVEAKLGNNKIEKIEKEVIICKRIEQKALQKSTITIVKGKTRNLNLDLGPEECYENIKYKVENEKIISFKENEKITGINEGKSKLEIIKGKDKAELLVKIIKQEDEKKVTGINFNIKNLTLEIGKTKRVNASVIPSNATNQGIIWTTDNDAIAIVSNKGEITGVGKGKATITAKTEEGNYKKSIVVTVTSQNGKANNPTSIKINKDKTSILVGKTEKLVATVLPTTAKNKEIKWISSNKKIVTINSEGVIEGKKEGKATITAKTTNGKTDKIEVTVAKEEIKVTKLTISSKTNKLYIGTTLTPDVEIKPSNATNQQLTWKSSNTQVAEIKDGIIIGKEEGEATITATTSNGKQSSMKVYVQNPLSYNEDTSNSELEYSDNRAPQATKVTISSDNKDKTKAKLHDKITLNINFDEVVTKPSVEIAGMTASVRGTLKKFTATVTVKADTPSQVANIKISNYKDIFGNVGSVITKTTDSSKVTIENSANEDQIQTESETPEEQEKYKIQYSAHGGTGKMSPEEINVGEKPYLTVNEFKREGYQFIGWVAYRTNDKKFVGCKNLYIYDSKNSSCGWNLDSLTKTYAIYGDNNLFGHGGYLAANDVVTMYAQWGKITNTKIEKKENETDVTIGLNLPKKTAWTIYTSPSKNSGYEKLGKSIFVESYDTIYHTFTTDKKEIIYVKACLNQTSSICVGPISIEVSEEKYTIKYNAHGGTGTMGSQSVKTRTAPTLLENKFSKTTKGEKYDFVGWAAYRNNPQLFVGCITSKVCKNTNSDYGWIGNNETTAYAIYKDQTTFGMGKAVQPNETVTMYAQWAKLKLKNKEYLGQKNIKVSFYVELPNKTQWNLYSSLTQNSGYTKVNNTTVYSNGQKKEINYTINSTNANQIYYKMCLEQYPSICTSALKVDFSAYPYTIKYNANGGSGTMNNSVLNYLNTNAIAANEFTKKDYDFLGWYAKNESGSFLGCTEAKKCSIENAQWRNDSNIKSYYVFPDGASFYEYIRKGNNIKVNRYETITLYATWGKIEWSGKDSCYGEKCYTFIKVKSSSKVSWDVYRDSKKTELEGIVGDLELAIEYPPVGTKALVEIRPSNNPKANFKNPMYIWWNPYK